MAGDISIVAIVKGEERYVFMFDDNSRAETLRTLGRYASDPELSFSWYDAAVLSQKIRQTQKSTSQAPPAPHFGLPGFPSREASLNNNNDIDSFSGFDFPNIDDMWIGDDPIG